VIDMIKITKAAVTPTTRCIQKTAFLMLYLHH
jgi:hypothetical protein